MATLSLILSDFFCDLPWTMFSLSMDLPISVLMLIWPNADGVINLTFSFLISTGWGMLAGFSPKSTSQSRSGKMDSSEKMNWKTLKLINNEALSSYTCKIFEINLLYVLPYCN